MPFPYQPMAPRVFGPVGECIYCGSRGPLSPEHIIPYAMGGRWVLPAASCLSCAACTSKFELNLLRSEAWWPLRRALDLPSRHPKKQRDSFRAVATTYQGPKSIMVDIRDHPLVLPIVRFDAPARLSGKPLPRGGDQTVIATELAVLPLRPLQGVGGLQIGFSSRARPSDKVTLEFDASLAASDLARLIAKIGWGWAVANHGLEAFEEVYVRDLILGDTKGGNEWFGELLTSPIRSSRELHAVGEIRHGNSLAVWVQLFSPAPAMSGAWPTYQAIVGRMTSAVGEVAQRG